MPGCSCTRSPAACSSATFTVKMLALTRRGMPGWVLPVLGGLAFALLVAHMVHLGLLVLLDLWIQAIMSDESENELDAARRAVSRRRAAARCWSARASPAPRCSRAAPRMTPTMVGSPGAAAVVGTCRLRLAAAGPATGASTAGRQRARGQRPRDHLAGPRWRRQDHRRHEHRGHAARRARSRRSPRCARTGLHRKHGLRRDHELPVPRQQVQHQGRLGRQRPRHQARWPPSPSRSREPGSSRAKGSSA